MADEIQSGMHCAEFETLLFEAIDGTLVAGTLTRFRAHAADCPSCGPLFADAQAGQQLLRSLAEVAPPRNLVHNILAKTSGVEERHPAQIEEASPSWREQVFGWLQPVLAGTWATVRQPRFGMSVAMAFFSVSMVMTVAGIKVNDLAKLDLRPGAVKRSYYSTQARVVKYYTNMRIFYEVESRLRDIKRATTPAEGEAPSPEKKERRKENEKTSGRPNKGQDRRQDSNQDYAQDEAQPVVARSGATDMPRLDSNFGIDAARREA